MNLLIDNFDGLGSEDYTAFVDSSKSPVLARKLNGPSELKFGLVAGTGSMEVPVTGGRVRVILSNGNDLFSGYVIQTPTYQYLGWADRGNVYRYEIEALSDVMLLDQKAPPPHPPFVGRNAGDAFEQLTTDALPGSFDVSGIAVGVLVAHYSVGPSKPGSTSSANTAQLAH